MSPQNIKLELKELLELINEQSELIQRQIDETPQLYIDMLKENILKFYEKLHILDKTKNNSLQAGPAKAISPKAAINEKPVLEPVQEVKMETIPEDKVLPVVKSVQTEKKEVKVDVMEKELRLKPQSIGAKTVEETKPQISVTDFLNGNNNNPEISSNEPIFKFKSPKSSDSLFKEFTPTIGDKLQADRDPSLAEAIQQKVIKDIKEEIGINDKFLMINELFDGDMKSYNEAIEQLNTKPDQKEALNALGIHLEEKKWDEENEAFLKLKNFVERRYK